MKEDEIICKEAAVYVNFHLVIIYQRTALSPVFKVPENTQYKSFGNSLLSKLI